jgi:hypothetical protein
VTNGGNCTGCGKEIAYYLEPHPELCGMCVLCGPPEPATAQKVPCCDCGASLVTSYEQHGGLCDGCSGNNLFTHPNQVIETDDGTLRSPLALGPMGGFGGAVPPDNGNEDKESPDAIKAQVTLILVDKWGKTDNFQQVTEILWRKGLLHGSRGE